ncbi:MAG TPA: hypothetical protein VFQ61_18990 [Polyangiaceae bacterium]|nr:hypothetical protein [Polyangiaceae bacterium]
MLEFVREVEDTERETLLVREHEDSVELALLLPGRLLEERADHDDDGLLQAFEGVSHFVYLAERVRMELPTTRLELELQAEVDKFVLLTHGRDRLEPLERDRLCEHLFERVSYLHHETTEEGARYRLANALAARFVRRLDVRAPGALRERLRSFYRAGQADKIRLASAA